MKVLMIGGSGLISTAISQAFLDRGDDLVLFNRGVSKVRTKGAARHIAGDRNDETALGAALRLEKPDAVIDMMAFAPDQGQALMRASDGQTPQLIFCSSVCVYGGPLTQLPATENEPHRPVGDYGRNKSALEAVFLGRGGANQHATVIRPSFSTGEGATINGLVFDDSTVNRLREGLPVVVMDDGKAAFAIAHVSDVASAFVGAVGNPKAYGQAYNATSDEHTDWNGIFTAMALAAGGPAPRFAHIPSHWLYAQAPRRAVGIEYIFKHPAVFDNRKAASDLGFQTKVPLVETFRRQIAWMEHNGTLKKTAEETVQDELSAAWAQQRDVAPGRFEDCNAWGNSTRG
jgi:nucleoside-diphosphate-sugar epimerase